MRVGGAAVLAMCAALAAVGTAAAGETRGEVMGALRGLRDAATDAVESGAAAADVRGRIAVDQADDAPAEQREWLGRRALNRGKDVSRRTIHRLRRLARSTLQMARWPFHRHAEQKTVRVASKRDAWKGGVSCTTMESVVTVSSTETDVPKIIYPVPADDKEDIPASARGPVTVTSNVVPTGKVARRSREDCERLMTKPMRRGTRPDDAPQSAELTERHGAIHRKGKRYLWYNLSLKDRKRAQRRAARRGNVADALQDMQAAASSAVETHSRLANAADDAQRRAADVRSDVRNIVKNVDSRVDNVQSSVVNRVNNVRSDVVNTVNNVRSDVVKRANNVRSDVANRVDNVRSDVQNTANNVRSDVASRVNNAQANVRNAVNNVQSDVRSTAGNVRSSVDNVKADVRNVRSDVQNNVRNTVNSVRSDVRSKADIARSNVQNRVDNVNNTANNVRSDVRNVARSVENSLQNTVNSVQNTVNNVQTDLQNTVNSLRSTVDSVQSSASVASDARSAAKTVQDAAAEMKQAAVSAVSAADKPCDPLADEKRMSPALESALRDVRAVAARPYAGAQLDEGLRAQVEQTLRQRRKAMRRRLDASSKDAPRSAAEFKAHMASFRKDAPHVHALIKARMAMAQASRGHASDVRSRLAKVVRLYEQRVAEERREQAEDTALRAQLAEAERRIANASCGNNKPCKDCHDVARELVARSSELMARTRARAERFRRRVARWARRSFAERAALFHALRVAQVRDAVGNERVRQLQTWYLQRVHAMDAEARARFEALVSAMRSHEARMHAALEKRLTALQTRVTAVASQSDASAGGVESKLDALAKSVAQILSRPIASQDGASAELHTKLDALSTLVHERLSAQPDARVCEQLRSLATLIRNNTSATAAVPAASAVDKHVREIGAYVHGRMEPMLRTQEALAAKLAEVSALLERTAAAGLSSRVSALESSLKQSHTEHAQIMSALQEGRNMIARLSDASKKLALDEQAISSRLERPAPVSAEHLATTKLMVSLSEMLTRQIFPMTTHLLEASKKHAAALEELKASAERCSCKSCPKCVAMPCVAPAISGARARVAAGQSASAVVRPVPAPKPKPAPIAMPVIHRIVRKVCVAERTPHPGAAPLPVARVNAAGCACTASAKDGCADAADPEARKVELEAARTDALRMREYKQKLVDAQKGCRRQCKVHVEHVVHGGPDAKRALAQHVQRKLAASVKADGSILAHIHEARADLGVAKPGEAADAVPRGSDLLF